ncbi:hypothetical protein JB92DRAFT_3214109 [Gautieria morchelliformis]|nr:hypothetical protein JB92DRAFT_3214109 [Gautieria morchelliformis]
MVAPSRVCGWHDSGDESIQCDCPKYAARPGQSPNTAVRCRECGHYRSWHDGSDEDTEIEPIVEDIMKKCQAEIGTLPKARATKVEATNEALSGLKKDIERTKSVVLTRTTWHRKRGRPVDKGDDLINNVTPDGDHEDQLESWGLTVTAHEQGDYWFQTEWSNKRINESVQEILPQSYRNWLKKDCAAPNGLDMEHVKGTAATRMRIPKQAYEMAWDISRINECLTTSGSDSESEYADNDKGKRNMKGKASAIPHVQKRSIEKSGLDKEVRKKKKGKYISIYHICLP